jgi:sorting nexin-1/2
VDAFKKWQSAESSLAKKREAVAKFKAQNKADKIAQAEFEVNEAARQLEETSAAFEAISKLIRAEHERFTVCQIHELQQVVIDYVESLMNLEHQTVKAWEAYLPEAKAVPIL